MSSSVLDTSVVAPGCPAERPGLASAIELISKVLVTLNSVVREEVDPLCILVVLKRTRVGEEILGSPKEEEVTLDASELARREEEDSCPALVLSAMVIAMSEGGGLLSDSVVMSEGPSPSTEVLVRLGKESGCCQLVLMTSVVF